MLNHTDPPFIKPSPDSHDAMNPYPARAELRAEAQVRDFMFAQFVANAELRSALLKFKRTVEAIEFPLGFPVDGYDKSDLIGVIDDCTKMREPDEQAAWDLVREMV